MQQEILTLFRAAEAAGPRGSDELFTALYAELHRLAERQLRRGGSEVSLSATTLLHEAYLDIAGRDTVEFPDRARFIGYAARAMRGMVIDHVRRSGAMKQPAAVAATATSVASMTRFDWYTTGLRQVGLSRIAEGEEGPMTARPLIH